MAALKPFLLLATCCLLAKLPLEAQAHQGICRIPDIEVTYFYTAMYDPPVHWMCRSTCLRINLWFTSRYFRYYDRVACCCTNLVSHLFGGIGR